MSRQSKLQEAFKACVGTFPYRDLCRLLAGLGYTESSKNGGSSRRFIAKDGHIIRLHEPHPSPDVPPYIVRQVQETLNARGLL